MLKSTSRPDPTVTVLVGCLALLFLIATRLAFGALLGYVLTPLAEGWAPFWVYLVSIAFCFSLTINLGRNV